MVFILSIICYMSITVTSGYLLYKYFISIDEIKKDELVLQPIKQHVEPICNKNEYTRISPTDDFDIINDDDISV